MSIIPKSTTLVFLGRSGCGKDTQIGFLMRRPDFKSAIKVNTGDAFRKIAEKDSPLGKKIKKMITEGGLAPMWFASSLWIHQIDDLLKNEEIILLDGVARQPKEAELLDEVMEFIARPKPIAILLDISEAESKKRLLLRGRLDDTEASILKRLVWFKTNAMVNVEYYRKAKRIIEINGEQAPGAVFKELEEKLDLYFK